MKLNESTLDRLKQALDGASEEKVERTKLLISSNTKVSDELKTVFLEAVEELLKKGDADGDAEEIPENLEDTLGIEEVQKYIELVKTEAYKQGYDEASLSSSVETEDTKEETESKEDSEEKTENADSEDSRQEIKEVLVDSIVQHATALRKSEIDMDRISESQKEYKDSLSEKNEEELQQIYKDLSKSMLDSFENIPSENLESETASEDSPEGSDSGNEDALSDAQTVLNKYFNQA